jgi:hypothetical protein
LWSYELKEYPRYDEHWHEEHMEYGDMNKAVVNLNGMHQWYLQMWSMPKPKKEGNLVILEASQPL